jgi:hypothetical protein
LLHPRFRRRRLTQAHRRWIAGERSIGERIDAEKSRFHGGNANGSSKRASTGEEIVEMELQDQGDDHGRDDDVRQFSKQSHKLFLFSVWNESARQRSTAAIVANLEKKAKEKSEERKERCDKKRLSLKPRRLLPRRRSSKFKSWA